MEQTITEENVLELSFSAMETFNLCPRKYFYNYILRLPKKDWPWLVFGTFVHLTLEKFHKYVIYFKKRNKEIDYGNLMKRAYLSSSRLYERQYKKNKKNKLTDKQKKQAKEILGHYLNEVKNNFPDVVFVEKGFRFKVGDFVIRGFIDRIDKLGENFYKIIDYKTSSASYEVDKNYQISLYAYMFKKLLKNENIKIKKELNFLKLKQIKTGEYNPKKEDKEIENYILTSGNKIMKSKIDNKEESDWKPVDNNFCQFCDFRDRCFNERGVFN